MVANHLTKRLCCFLTAWVSFRQLRPVEPRIWDLRWNLHLIDLFNYFESKEFYGSQTCTLQIGGLWRRDPQNKSQLEEEHLSPVNNHPLNTKHCQAVQTSFTCQQPTNKPTTFWSSSKLSWDVSSFSPFLPELTCHCPADPCNTEATWLLDLSKMFGYTIHDIDIDRR